MNNKHELRNEELEQVVGSVGGSATLDVARELAQSIFGGMTEIELPFCPITDMPVFQEISDENNR